MYHLKTFVLFLGTIAEALSQCPDAKPLKDTDVCKKLGLFHWEVLGIQNRSFHDQMQELVDVVLQGFDCERRVKNVRCPGVNYTCQQIRNEILSNNSTLCSDPDFLRRLLMVSVLLEDIPCFDRPPQPGPPPRCQPPPMSHFLHKVASLWRPELMRHRIWNGCSPHAAFVKRRKCSRFSSPWPSRNMCPCFGNIISHLIQGRRILTDPMQKCDVQYMEDIFKVFGDSSAEESYLWRMGKDGLSSVLQNLSNPYPPLNHTTLLHHTLQFHPHNAANAIPVVSPRSFSYPSHSLLMYQVPCNWIGTRPHRPAQEPPMGSQPQHGHAPEQDRGTSPPHRFEQELPRGTPYQGGHGQEPPRGTPSQGGHGQEPPRGTPSQGGHGQEPPRETQSQDGHGQEPHRGTPSHHGHPQDPQRGPNNAILPEPNLGGPGFRHEGHDPVDNGNTHHQYGYPVQNIRPVPAWNEHGYRESTSPAPTEGPTATTGKSGSEYSQITHTPRPIYRPGYAGFQRQEHGKKHFHVNTNWSGQVTTNSKSGSISQQGFTSSIAESSIRVSTLRPGTKPTPMQNVSVPDYATNTSLPVTGKYKETPRSKRTWIIMPSDSHHVLQSYYNYHSPEHVWNATVLMEMMLGTANSSLTIPDFYEMCPILIHYLLFTFNLPVTPPPPMPPTPSQTTSNSFTTISNTSNTSSNTSNTNSQTPATTAEVYGYSSLAVFIISLCSLGGGVFVKMSKGKIGNYVMASMLAMAVGNLCGDAVLHLVPEVIGEEGTDSDGDGHFTNEVMLLGNSDIEMNSVKMMLMLASIYLFFLLEMVMSVYHKHDHVTETMIFIPESQIPKKKALTRVTGSTAHLTSSNSTLSSMEVAIPSSIDSLHSLPSVPEEDEDPEEQVQITIQKQDNLLAPMTLAWMVIVGDSIHNFADGLEIGATFSDGLASGLSTSLAVFCHELPHELGDFAALISTGMSVKRALILNFVSGLTAFIGLYIGLVSGQHSDVRRLIFSIGAGMFIYVALANLVPELMKYFERTRNWKMFLCQHVGLLFGYTVMVLIAIFEDEISL
ncbi:zinc transporter ZIP10-like [Haliotis asinina]|uniref:zinc transporter ZIP10-like n=1 Tax=Haliotis asinina TaxID=109174 RepID=UPI003531F7B5